MAEFLQAIPSLAVSDVGRSRRFYERLGFRVAAHLPPSGPAEWLRLERDTVALMVWNQVMTPPEVLAAIRLARGAGSTIFIAVSNVDRVARELQDRGVAPTRPAETMPDGMRELTVLDPDGFRISFGSRVRAA